MHIIRQSIIYSRRIVWRRGQAQGPLIRSTRPPVPTGRGTGCLGGRCACIYAMTIHTHSLFPLPNLDGGVQRGGGDFLAWIRNPGNGVDGCAMSLVGEGVAAIGCAPDLHGAILAGGCDERDRKSVV